jgi:hypothetical protein
MQSVKRRKNWKRIFRMWLCEHCHVGCWKGELTQAVIVFVGVMSFLAVLVTIVYHAGRSVS